MNRDSKSGSISYGKLRIKNPTLNKLTKKIVSLVIDPLSSEKMSNKYCKRCFKNTHRENAPSNKTPALTNSMNMDIWIVGISNQHFVRGS